MMNKTRISKITVVANESGGVVFISADHASVVIMQKKWTDCYDENGILSECITEQRLAELEDTSDRILKLNLQPGDTLDGNIYIKQQIEPVVENDPQAFLLRDMNSKVVTDQHGNAIYQLSYFSKSHNEDVILVNPYSSL